MSKIRRRIEAKSKIKTPIKNKHHEFSANDRIAATNTRRRQWLCMFEMHEDQCPSRSVCCLSSCHGKSNCLLSSHVPHPLCYQCLEKSMPMSMSNTLIHNLNCANNVHIVLWKIVSNYRLENTQTSLQNSTSLEATVLRTPRCWSGQSQCGK